MFYIPFTTNPIGWAIIGISGYALYKRGKKKGEEEVAASQITAAPEPVETKNEDKGAK